MTNIRLLLAFFLFSHRLHATDVLERSISVQFEQTPLKEALAEVAQKGGFKWSYNARALDGQRRVTLLADQWTVREILLVILGDGYTFKQSGEYLILKKRKKPEPRLSGYISDRRTGQRISGVTVYDRQTLKSTITDRNGYYELPVTARSEIVVAKLSYRDTLLQVNSETPRLVKFDLYVDTLPRAAPSPLRRGWNRVVARAEELFVSSAQQLSALNVRDSLRRVVQFSFLPGLSSNHRLGGSVVNDWSINLLIGYSRGNRILELASLGNINRDEVRGVQAAGLCNIGGGRVGGVQAAGLFNNVSGSVAGFQAAGLYNFVGDTLGGMQSAGAVNVAAYGRRRTVQVAGAVNVLVRGLSGAQIAGFANHARQVRGIQVAGTANSADTLQGCQVAGFFNRAGYVRGVQIGLLNVAREIHGVQVGLLNFSKTGGYTALEGSTTDVLPANVAFKSGVPALYTILTAGADPAEPAASRLWGYGLGLGMRTRRDGRFAVSMDFLHRHLSMGSHDTAVQEWLQFAPALELKLFKHLMLAGGPTLNLFAADPAATDSETIRNRLVTRNLLNTEDTADGWLSAWWGWMGAVRVRF